MEKSFTNEEIEADPYKCLPGDTPFVGLYRGGIASAGTHCTFFRRDLY